MEDFFSDNFVLELLKVKFPEEDILWRPGTTTKDKSAAMALAYVDARAVYDRLDTTVGPSNWSTEITPIKVSKETGIKATLIIHLPSGRTVSRQDVSGETAIEALKGGASKSIVRVGAQFGIGRYLYDLPTQWVDLEKGRYFKKTPKMPKEFLPENQGAKISLADKSALDAWFVKQAESLPGFKDELRDFYKELEVPNRCPGRSAIEVLQEAEDFIKP